MMQSMKGATKLLGSMNRQMNLPALQRIAMEFERENDIMDQRQEMMDDAIDDVTGLEDEEEGEEVVNQVLDEIGVDLGQAVSWTAILPTSTGSRVHSLEKHRPAFKVPLWQKAKSLRQSAVTLVMTTSRLDSTVCGDELDRKMTLVISEFMTSVWRSGRRLGNFVTSRLKIQFKENACLHTTRQGPQRKCRVRMARDS